jgi:hypothetical protein
LIVKLVTARRTSTRSGSVIAVIAQVTVKTTWRWGTNARHGGVVSLTTSLGGTSLAKTGIRIVSIGANVTEDIVGRSTNTRLGRVGCCAQRLSIARNAKSGTIRIVASVTNRALVSIQHGTNASGSQVVGETI